MRQILNMYRLIPSMQHRPTASPDTPDPNVRYPTTCPLPLNERTIFPRKPLAKTLSASATELNKLILAVFNNEIYIPSYILSEIVLYTLTLVPGIYNFEGWSLCHFHIDIDSRFFCVKIECRFMFEIQGIMTVGWSDDNGCSCRLILDDDSCIVGGTFQEV